MSTLEGEKLAVTKRGGGVNSVRCFAQSCKRVTEKREFEGEPSPTFTAQTHLARRCMKKAWLFRKPLLLSNAQLISWTVDIFVFFLLQCYTGLGSIRYVLCLNQG